MVMPGIHIFKLAWYFIVLIVIWSRQLLFEFQKGLFKFKNFPYKN